MIRLSRLRESLRVRLLAGTLIWIVVSIAIAGWGLGALIREHVERQFLAELRTHLDQLTANLVVDPSGRPQLTAPLSDARLSRPYSGLYWQVDAIAGGGQASVTGLLRSRSLWDQVLEVSKDALPDGQLHQHRVHGPQQRWLTVLERGVYPAESPERPLRLIIAADERAMLEPVAQFRGTMWLALSLLGLGLISAAVMQVMIGLAPLERLQHELAAVREGKAQLMSGAYPAEVSPLVGEFNRVLQQNAEIVERARTAAGNLAHALKTPLTVMANAARSKESGLPTLVSEQVEIARRQVDYHLRRARSAAATRVPGVRTPIGPVAAGLARAMQRIHADRGLDIVVETIPESLAFRGEEQDLQELLGNVLENACKWAHRRVVMQARREDGRLRITVDDDGKGIEVDRRRDILGRGMRADEQVEGSGLGLAIVDELARLYGGEIHLEDSPLGGLRVQLVLPAAS
jgi:signal transduction histidine kinase